MKKTLENLTKAFIGESQARNRYTFYAKVAQKEGYEQISAIFTETAEQEKEHAKQLFKLINSLKENEEALVVEAEVPTTFGNTIENLKSAIAGENHEYTSMYPEFAAIAKEEGYAEIAVRLIAIGMAEAHHENRYKKLLAELEAGTLFKKDEAKTWFCRKCGYKHVGKNAPEKCSSCDHPTAYFQLDGEVY